MPPALHRAHKRGDTVRDRAASVRSVGLVKEFEYVMFDGACTYHEVGKVLHGQRNSLLIGFAPCPC